jgi:hypothetical protein
MIHVAVVKKQCKNNTLGKSTEKIRQNATFFPKRYN